MRGAALARLEVLAVGDLRSTQKLLEKEDPCALDGVSLPLRWRYVQKIINAVHDLSHIIEDDESILISVKNQKDLKQCFQSVACLGILPNLIAGVGLDIKSRCENSIQLPPMQLNETEKYKLLKLSTDLYVDSYRVPVLKNIILTEHLADYLAALIQLSYAPLKKPGNYKDFTMTHDMYNQLQSDRAKYGTIFETLVSTCFQPMVMKSLLLLQTKDPPPPQFFSRIISKELSKRLLTAGGLMSLIRCFIESQHNDAGHEWKKIDLIRRIVGTKHGSLPDEIYLKNMCGQLKEIISSYNLHYYSTATACILHLHEKYPQSAEVQHLSECILKCFDYEYLTSNHHLPGTVLLAPQEIEHKINILHACFCTTLTPRSSELIAPNVYIIFLILLKCTKSQDLRDKINEMIVIYLEGSNETDLAVRVKNLIFGRKDTLRISIEEFASGMMLKYVANDLVHPVEAASKYIIELVKKCEKTTFASKTFEICLEMLLSLTEQRKKTNRALLSLENDTEYIDIADQTYALTLQLLEELSGLPNVLSFIKSNPENIILFIESILLRDVLDKTDECVTIALVLLSTMLSESNNLGNLKQRCWKMKSVLEKISLDGSANSLLANEVLTMTANQRAGPSNQKSAYELALSDVFDHLLPVRAHGLMELTKLIDQKDVETISKRHYLMCLFQEQLKDEDSYIYLSAINGIAALGKHCAEDVLVSLCKEFLQGSVAGAEADTNQATERRVQLRMKVGDVIVKVTRSLGEMAVVHKTVILNTVLCCCRDEEPLVRASALSNLAELARVLHYKLGAILAEILLCIWGVLETDKAPECRRAAVLVVSSLLQGLGPDVLLQLKDNLLPIYRALKHLYRDSDEDAVVRLHAQIALEELNEVVKDFLIPKVGMEKNIQIADLERAEIKFK